MKKLFLIVFMMALVNYTLAQSEEVNIWPKKAPKEVVLKSGKPEMKMNKIQVMRVLQQPVPTLQKYEARNARDKVMLICPGGGYSVLAIDLEGSEIAQWLNSIGYTAYVLRYRVPDCREGDLQDVQRAMRLVRAENPDKKIGVMGFSAGASLSARISTLYDSVTYTPIDSVDALSARPDFTGLIYPAYMDLGENNTLTPELKVNAKTPPMFVFQTADDPCGNSSLVISQALRNNKVPVELHFYPKGKHGYGLRPGLAKVGSVWPKLMEKWMESLSL